MDRLLDMRIVVAIRMPGDKQKERDLFDSIGQEGCAA